MYNEVFMPIVCSSSDVSGCIYSTFEEANKAAQQSGLILYPEQPVVSFSAHCDEKELRARVEKIDESGQINYALDGPGQILGVGAVRVSPDGEYIFNN